MKFTLSTAIAYAASTALLGFWLPIFTSFLSSAASTCQTVKPPYLITTNDFISMGHFQEDCQKDSLAAVSSFAKAIRLNHQAEEPYYHRANAYYNLGNYPAAVADYSEVIRQNTGKFGLSNPAYWNRARAYAKLGEKQNAITDLTQFINNSNSSADAYFFRGNMYRDLGNKANAIADYKVAENIFQQYLNGSFGTGHIEPHNQEMLEKVRNELSQMN